MIFPPIPYKDERVTNPETSLVAKLIAINIAAVALTSVLPERAYQYLLFSPSTQPVWWWPVSLVTCSVLHANLRHLFGNMWFFWLFGPRVEEVLGKRFLALYLLGHIVGVTVFTYMAWGSHFRLLGASAAVSAVVAAYCFLFPRATICCVSWLFYYRPHLWDAPAPMFALVFFAKDFFKMAVGDAGHVAHAAHVGGALYGLGVALRSHLEVTPERARELQLWEHHGRRLGLAKQVASDWKASRHDEAWEGLMRGFREDPLFCLEGPLQLDLALRLRQEGRMVPARTALQRLIQAAPEGAEAARAWFNLGEIELSALMDPATAAESFDQAQRHASAGDALKARAGEGLAEAQAVMRDGVDRASPADGPCDLLLAVATAPRSAQLAAAARILEEPEETLAARLAVAPGRLAERLAPERLRRVSRALQSLGLDTLIVPSSWLAQVPAAKWVRGLRLGLATIGFDGDEAPVEDLPWNRCLLVAAASVEARWAGEDGSPADAKRLPLLEIWCREPETRFRWIASEDLTVGPEEEKRFFDALQDVVMRAPAECLAAGAHAAFDRRLPDSCAAQDFPDLDALLGWQAALARSRLEGRLENASAVGGSPPWLAASVTHRSLPGVDAKPPPQKRVDTRLWS